MVSKDTDTAYSIWRGIRNLFHDNKNTRVVYLGTEFRNFYQGDLTALDYYCSHMKIMADRLAGLSAPMNDKDLICNIVHSLNLHLHHATPRITLRPSPPPAVVPQDMIHAAARRTPHR
ncbi:uncharacterized protein LOC110436996 [Sorghum bicolor]|uniref:uncharacterized protein LOC110436996 n=1 Tax=Sorghum bicolor TaxID=4558 RepID=UPI000B426ADA|nr:uncharacterized protein LOC110436996 [Sorghum bicolor]|eukprot:XP_021320594.1 uncharacterized protein LOC110436996 [Sorghum bicolor]